MIKNNRLLSLFLIMGVVLCLFFLLYLKQFRSIELANSSQKKEKAKISSTAQDPLLRGKIDHYDQERQLLYLQTGEQLLSFPLSLTAAIYCWPTAQNGIQISCCRAAPHRDGSFFWGQGAVGCIQVYRMHRIAQRNRCVGNAPYHQYYGFEPRRTPRTQRRTGETSRFVERTAWSYPPHVIASRRLLAARRSLPQGRDCFDQETHLVSQSHVYVMSSRSAQWRALTLAHCFIGRAGRPGVCLTAFLAFFASWR